MYTAGSTNRMTAEKVKAVVEVNGSNCRILEMAHGLALDHTDNDTVVPSIDWKSRQLKSCKLLWLEMIET